MLNLKKFFTTLFLALVSIPSFAATETKDTTSLVECDEDKGYEVSADGKRCVEKTAEQPAVATTQNNTSSTGTRTAKRANEKSKEIESERKKIQEASKSIKLGDKITFKKDFENDLDGVLTTWKSNCKTADKKQTEKAKDSEAKRTVLLPNVTYTCKLAECDEGFKPDNTGLKCEKTSEQKKKDNKDDKEKCEKQKEKGAKWEINKCTCTEKTKEWDGEKCILKTGECSTTYGKGKGKYNDKGVCELDTCEKPYTVSADKTKCELESTHDIKEKKADDAYSKEIDELIADYKQFVQKLAADCKQKGGTLTDEGCDVPKQ